MKNNNKYQKFLNNQKTGNGFNLCKSFFKRLVKSIQPVKRVSPDEWADEYRYITKGSRPGKWDTTFTNYLREPSQDFINDDVESVVLMWSTQVGKTAFMENIIGTVIHKYPAPMYFVMPDESLIRDFKQEKLEDMFESTSLFYKDGLVKRATPGKSDTNDRKIRFNGGYIAFASSNSMSALAGRSIRFLFLDEVDRFKVDKGEGDVLVIAKNRTNSFAENRKILITSTPTDSQTSRINKAFLQGDQRRYKVACPHCGHKQFLIFNNLEWEKEKDKDGKNIHKAETAYYRCESNGCRILTGHKQKLIRSGYWEATAVPKDKKLRSYHLNVLYSPFVSFEDVVRDYLAAKDTPGGLRAFYNTALAEVYDDPAEQPQYEKMYERAETYNRAIPPSNVGFLTCGADIQEKGDGRLEASVWGWAPNNQRYLIDHIVINGSYKDQATWDEFTQFRQTKYTTTDGRELGIAMTLVDSSAGNTTNYVYEYCRLYRFDNVKAVKGSSNQASKIYELTKLENDSNGKRLRNSIELIRPNVHQFKKWLYHAIQEVTDQKAPYYVHTGQFAGLEWHRQLCAEKLVIKNFKEQYVKTYSNEALDCAVYAHAAAELLGLSRTDWSKLFKKQGVELEKPEENAKNTVDLYEICILKRVQLNKKWHEPGDILEVEKPDCDRLCTGIDPFAHKTSEKPPLQREIKKAIANNNKKQKIRNHKSWFSY